MAEERTVYSTDSPGWLRAVGRLEVPGSRIEDGRRNHHREDCSATLVAMRPGMRADTVVTAWHCLEFYSDLSKPIVFTLPPGANPTLSRIVYRVADGGGMHADWAVLKMHQPIPVELVSALPLHPGRADAHRPIAMAGYSRDTGLGKGGDQLTYHDACNILFQEPASSDTDCIAYKGASGGAVVQLSPTGEVLFSGVVSRGDSNGLSIFVPTERFRSRIR